MYAIYNKEDGKIISTIITDNINIVKLNVDSSLQSFMLVDSIEYTHVIDKKPVIIETPVIINYRGIRDSLLRQSDFSQLPDSPLTEEQKQAWTEYRQQLRDYPSTIVDPFNPPPFPTKPS